MTPKHGLVRVIGTLILIGSFFASSMLALVWLDRERSAVERSSDLFYLPKGDYAKWATLGYRQAAADLIWLKAIQHFGERKQTAQGYRWAYHAVDVVTDLDPQFSFAYLVAGTILGIWAGQVEESISILTKGMQHNPTVWQLPFTVGYDYYFELCDAATAARYFRIAATLPGSPQYLPKLAARMTVEGSGPDAALEFLEHFSQQTSDERLLEALEQRAKEVVIERDIQGLDRAVKLYKARFGRLPEDLQQLVNGGILDRLPLEPLGGKYELNKTTGTVFSTKFADRLVVHRQTPCRGTTTPKLPYTSDQLAQHS